MVICLVRLVFRELVCVMMMLLFMFSFRNVQWIVWIFVRKFLCGIVILLFWWLYCFLFDIWFLIWMQYVFVLMNCLVSRQVVFVLLKFVLMLVMIGMMCVMWLLIFCWIVVLVVVFFVVFSLWNRLFSLWVLVWCRNVYSLWISVLIEVFLCIDWFGSGLNFECSVVIIQFDRYRQWCLVLLKCFLMEIIFCWLMKLCQ